MCWFRRKHKPKTMTQLQWLYSYEVFLVDTASGNLELGTYTLSELESNYWIYDPSKDPPHLTARPFPVKPNGKRVNIIGRQSYDVFRAVDGTKLYERCTKEEYEAMYNKTRKPQKSVVVII